METPKPLELMHLVCDLYRTPWAPTSMDIPREVEGYSYVGIILSEPKGMPLYARLFQKGVRCG